MSAWPEDMKVGPIREWPGAMTPAQSRRVSPFRAGLTGTLKTLDRELYELAETRQHQLSAELLVAIPAGAFRRDGRPRADARAEHPGVVLSMDTKHGHLSYPCDTFTTWEDNLRAIALALEALRKVDRYGVTRRGEQYRGFLALEQGTLGGDAAVQAALDVVASFADSSLKVADTNEYIAQRYRVAMRAAHPDSGGSTEAWLRLSEACDVLRTAGRL